MCQLNQRIKQIDFLLQQILKRLQLLVRLVLNQYLGVLIYSLRLQLLHQVRYHHLPNLKWNIWKHTLLDLLEALLIILKYFCFKDLLTKLLLILGERILLRDVRGLDTAPSFTYLLVWIQTSVSEENPEHLYLWKIFLLY